MNPTRNHEVEGSIPGLTQWVQDPALLWAVVLCRRRGWDLALLWLWRSPAAIALFRPLAWEPLCAMGPALKRQKTKQNKKSIRESSHCGSEMNLTSIHEDGGLIHGLGQWVRIRHCCVL